MHITPSLIAVRAHRGGSRTLARSAASISLATAIACAALGQASAEDPPKIPTKAGAQPTLTVTSATASAPHGFEAWVDECQKRKGDQTPRKGDQAEPRCAGLGDRLKVTVDGLKDWLAKDKDGKPRDGKLTDEQLKQIRLILDGRTIPGLPLEPAPNLNTVTFDLDYSSDAREAWRKLLGSASAWRRDVPVTVTVDGVNPLPRDGDATIQLVMISRTWFTIWFVLVLAIFIGFCILAYCSDLLRDAGPPPGLDAQNNPLRKPYSLGRMQMACWLFVVLASFLFIGIVTGIYAVSAQAVALMGVSAATAVGAVAIDRAKRNAQDDQRGALAAQKQTLTAKQKTLTDEIAVNATKLGATPPPPPDEAAKLTLAQSVKQNEHAEATTRLRKIDADLTILGDGSQAAKSEGFFRDMLSDETGVSLHRFQMLVWTVVLGLVFLSQVYKALTMPDLSPELLALLGISGGTYLGFKMPERKT